MSAARGGQFHAGGLEQLRSSAEHVEQAQRVPVALASRPASRARAITTEIGRPVRWRGPRPRWALPPPSARRSAGRPRRLPGIGWPVSIETPIRAGGKMLLSVLEGGQPVAKLVETA